MWRCEVNDAEKIETLRRWAKRDRTYWSFEKTAGYTDAQRQVRDIIDPPKPKWRQKVDEWALVVSAVQKVDEWALVVSADPTLADVLGSLSGIARSGPSVSERATGDRLAQLVAICERRVGDGWQADPDRVPVGHWGISWLLVTLSHEPPSWNVLGDRAAAWLRSLTDGGVA
jgi:hypothetical protein